MKIIIERIWELLEESSGEAYESLEERKETILGQISSCEEELTDLHELLAGYSYDMQNVIAPVYRDRTMVVDRNDIWFNMQSILRACDRIASMVYNVNVPWFGTTYTAFAEDAVKKKETKYYNRLEEVREKIQRKYQDSIAVYKDELVKLYENKVVVYENTDDVYASKVSKDYYPKYTSPGEEVLNIFEWLGDAVTGFTGGVMEGVIGVIDGIGEFILGIGEFAISECVVLVNKGMGSEPSDWAVKNVEETKAQIGAILDEPMLLIEGMAQGVSDTYESEGIWYCAGYAVGTYAGTKRIAEVGKEVKGKVGVKGKVESGEYSSFGYMSQKDGEVYEYFWKQVASGEPRWGERPNAELLYSKEYIQNHIKKFENGGSYLVSKDVYYARIEDSILNPYLGRPGELFISPLDQINEALIKSGGDIAKLEKIMGFDSGTDTKHGGIVRIDIKKPLDYEIRLPSGNEYGANIHFISGGKTDGGALEAVINNVPNSEECRSINLNPFEILNGGK